MAIVQAEDEMDILQQIEDKMEHDIQNVKAQRDIEIERIRMEADVIIENIRNEAEISKQVSKDDAYQQIDEEVNFVKEQIQSL